MKSGASIPMLPVGSLDEPPPHAGRKATSSAETRARRRALPRGPAVQLPGRHISLEGSRGSRALDCRITIHDGHLPENDTPRAESLLQSSIADQARQGYRGIGDDDTVRITGATCTFISWGWLDAIRTAFLC